MKILGTQQTRDADAYTIAHEPIASNALMERAARACHDWIVQRFAPPHTFYIFCGRGNNGGDGLALARMLEQSGHYTQVFLLDAARPLSADALINLDRYRAAWASQLHLLDSGADLPILPPDAILVDALYGTGLNKPIEGVADALVQYINRSPNTVVSIDIPSGLQGDAPTNLQSAIIKARYTLTFQQYKLAMLLPQTGTYCGETFVLDIGLHPDFINQCPSFNYMTDPAVLRKMYKVRSPFSHKGTYGHAAIVAGSKGKIGAAVLATQSCLHSGAGLVTTHIPACGYEIMQTSVPEAMCITDQHEQHLTEVFNTSAYTAIGVGPGIGIDPLTMAMLRQLLPSCTKPMVLDADALNAIAQAPDLLARIPAHSILTPHPKEFERLFGAVANDFERLELQRSLSREHQLYIVYKNRYTTISTPEGYCFFNATGNPGMATGGSGDVLTGILTSLLAQGYTSLEAALMGVWLHGIAGDEAAAQYTQPFVAAGNIIEKLPNAFNNIISG
jgi:NAD(P)H-hydrate epimerase